MMRKKEALGIPNGADNLFELCSSTALNKLKRSSRACHWARVFCIEIEYVSNRYEDLIKVIRDLKENTRD